MGVGSLIREKNTVKSLKRENMSQGTQIAENKNLNIKNNKLN